MPVSQVLPVLPSRRREVASSALLAVLSWWEREAVGGDGQISCSNKLGCPSVLDLKAFGGCGGGSSSSKVLASARHGGEMGWGSRGGGGHSSDLQQDALCWSGAMEAGRRRRLSLWLRLEVDDDVLAGARGGVPADGRSKVTDSGVVPDESCGTQRSLAAIELQLALGVWRSRVVSLAALRRRWSLAAASSDVVVGSKDLQGLLCNFLFIQGSFAPSPGQVVFELVLGCGCVFELFVSV